MAAASASRVRHCHACKNCCATSFWGACEPVDVSIAEQWHQHASHSACTSSRQAPCLTLLWMSGLLELFISSSAFFLLASALLASLNGQRLIEWWIVVLVAMTCTVWKSPGPFWLASWAEGCMDLSYKISRRCHAFCICLPAGVMMIPAAAEGSV